MATFTGTDGNDTLNGTNSGDRMFGRSGNDRLFGLGGNDQIFGQSGSDRLSGGSGADLVDGGSGDDTLTGESGDDTLIGGYGNDALDGGSGNDRVFAGEGADQLAGGSGNDILSGGSGNDRADGGEGTDRIDGGSGDDQLSGGGGNDRLFGGDGFDQMDGGPGNDTYFSNQLADEFNPGDVLIDSGGHDRVIAPGGFLPDGIEDMLIRTDQSQTTATGNGLDNLIRNESEAEAFIDGGDGDDKLIGGNAFDFFTLSRGNDFVDGRGGPDWLVGGSVNFLTSTATINGGTTRFINIEIAEGSSGADTLIADNSGRQLHGGEGNDSVTGGQGDDDLFGDGGFDHPDTLAGDDVISGLGGDDSLSGGNGSDILDGGPGTDTLDGGPAGTELIDGVPVQDDTADAFLFSAAAGNANADEIEDFVAGLDELRFDNDVFTALGAPSNWTSSDPRFYAASGAETSGTEATDFLVYNTASGNLYYDADGAGGGPSEIVATLDSAPALSASDIAVI